MGALVNIALDPLFIFGLFGLPKLGIVGAAIATVVGQIVAALIVMKKGFRKSPPLSVSPRDFILGEIIVDISDGVRENHSKAGHDYQIIKQPKTYEQQVELNTKIIFKNKIYKMNTIDEVSSRLIRVFS